MQDDDLITNYEELLERVDEYTLYCFYLGFAPELDMVYRSPIRDDDLHPSWSLFMSKYRRNVEFMWKDKGAGGISGDIWGLIRRLYSLSTMAQVLARVKSDFHLGPVVEGERKLVQVSAPVIPPRIDIRVKSKDFDRFDKNWWKGINVGERGLGKFNISRIRYYFKYIDQEHPNVPKNPAYAYRIMGKYQLYFPFERKQDKFRSELSDRELMGFEQLAFSSPLLLITKSYKEVVCLESFGYEAVAARSESIMIPPDYMDYLRSRYPIILILFDNDGKTNAHLYPEPKIEVPVSSRTKDPTDFCRKYGPKETDSLLKQLTDGYCQAHQSRNRGEAGDKVPW